MKTKTEIPMSATTNGSVAGSQSAPASILTGEIRDLRGDVSGFTILETTEARKLITKYTIDPKYIESTINAVSGSTMLQAAVKFDPDTARAAIRTDAAYGPCEQEAHALGNGIHGMRLVAYTDAIDICDAVLAMGRGIIRQPTKGMTDAQKADMKSLKALIKSMMNARKKRRKTTDAPKAKTTPKKAARAAKKATTTAQKAADRAQRATARAEAAAVKATGGVNIANGKADAKATTNV